MKHIYSIFVSLLIFIFSSASLARTWDRIKIPGAYCGDGTTYSVFFDKKESANLLIEFMGGGACWSLSTCYGPNFRTWAHPIPKAPALSYLTSDFARWKQHPFKNDSALYFPYCTGDVHAGNHIAQYGPLKTYHTGYSNIQLALQYLTQNKILNFQDKKRVTVWGASAGAIGTLVHMKTIESYVPTHVKKYAFIDSPGLHFGKEFWHKFTPELFNDYQTTFGKLGLYISPNDGFIAPQLAQAFHQYSSWEVGILQATKDIIMSSVFGDISPDEHKKLLESAQGLPSIAKSYSNIHVWIQDSILHTFLVLSSTAKSKSTEDVSARDFVNDVLTK